MAKEQITNLRIDILNGKTNTYYKYIKDSRQKNISQILEDMFCMERHTQITNNQGG
jgi:hypothetical protein